MNNRLQKKIQERLMGLTNEAGDLKEQIAELKDFDSVKEELEKQRLECELTDVLARIKRISTVANKHY